MRDAIIGASEGVITRVVLWYIENDYEEPRVFLFFSGHRVLSKANRARPCAIP